MTVLLGTRRCVPAYPLQLDFPRKASDCLQIETRNIARQRKLRVRHVLQRSLLRGSLGAGSALYDLLSLFFFSYCLQLLAMQSVCNERR